MSITEGLEPATSMFSGGLSRIFSYAWLLIPIIIIVGGFMAVWLYKKIKDKKGQWTHTLRVRRVLQDDRLTDPIFHKMRRFPLIKKAEVFELEKPLLGSYLIPELDEYSGHNEFSIILDKNNRIYTNKGEFFIPDKSSVNVSAKHSEIDIQRQNLKANFQNINAINKRIEWATIAKYAFMITAIIAASIVLIVGIQKWAETQDIRAQEAQASLDTMKELKSVMQTIEGTKNTDILILDKLKELYGTKNIQSVINEKT
jgi:hypothetical protein